MAKPKSYNNDSFDIGELAALNDDISDDFIDQLHAKLTSDIKKEGNAFTDSNTVNINDDSTLFEEPAPDTQELNNTGSETVNKPLQEADKSDKSVTVVDDNSSVISSETAITASSEASAEAEPQKKSDTAVAHTKKEEPKLNDKFDDNFIKKYKAKLNKKVTEQKEASDDSLKSRSVSSNEKSNNESIDKLSNGNITEKQLTQELKEYNDSLDFLDGNVKYSKYVIYIDPENVDFIEGLSVKERKNLINNIIRNQDDIELIKHRFKKMQIIFVHIIVAILVFSLTIPLFYSVINASLEATIDNNRKAQNNWQELYRQAGKLPK